MSLALSATGLALISLIAGAAPAATANKAQLGNSAGTLQISSEERPGKDDPLRNPARYTLFSDDAVYMPAAQNLHPVEVTLRPGNPNLRDWTMQADAGKHCASAGQRYARGRIASPKYDQIVCVTDGEVVMLNPARRFALPDAASAPNRPVAVAVGDLDGFADADGVRHDEIAVSYQRSDGGARLYVLDSELKPVASWDAPPRSSYQSALAVGDFAGQGRDAIALALSASGPTSRAKKTALQGIDSDLTLYTFRLDIDRQSNKAVLVKVDSKQQRSDHAFASIELAAGDFDGDGRDELALGYYAIASTPQPLKLELYDTDSALRLQTLGSAQESAPWPKSYATLNSGLLHLAPPQYTVQRRQLMASWVDVNGGVQVAVYDVENSHDLRRRSLIQVDKLGSVNQAGPGITAGNFVGLSNVSSPISQIAVQIPVPSGTATFPRFIVLNVDNKDFSLSELHRHDYKEFTSAGRVWAQEITAYDPDGKSYYLGAPIHITIPEIIDTKYVIQEPPKHVDCMPVADDDCDMLNVSGSPQFYMELSDSSEHTLETTQRDSTSWDLGSSVAATSSTTVGGGFGDIGSASVTANSKTAVSYDYNEITETTNSLYKSTVVQSSETTNFDDHAIYDARLLDIWRYPVYGMTLLNPPEQQGYYEVILPGPSIEINGAASIHDWYQPLHQNNNALSYPSTSDPLFPPDLGSFLPQGAKTPVREPMNNRVMRYWDGNQQTYDISWNERSGSTSSKTYGSSLRETLDVGLGFEASVDAFFVNARQSLQFDFNFQNSNSWQNNSISNTQMASSRGVRLYKPSDGTARQAYGFESLVYITDQGTLRVAHAANLVAASSGAPWWRKTYGLAPDPGLNLPHRVAYSSFDGWAVSPEPERYFLRGFFLRKSEKNPVTGDYDFVSRLLDGGEKIKVQARVYNFSLHAEPVTFDTLIQVAQVDPITGDIIGAKSTIGRESTTLGQQAHADVSLTWDTGSLGVPAGKVQYFRFFVTVDPDNALPDEIHKGLPHKDSNNYGFWPWDGGVGVVGKTAAPILDDQPLHAAKLEIIEADGHKLATSIARGHHYRLRATFDGGSPHRQWTSIYFLSGNGSKTWNVLGSRTLHGTANNASSVSMDWSPQTKGAIGITAMSIEDLLRQDPKLSSAATLQVKVD